MIRKATAADLDGVSAIYEAVLDREEATGCRWTNWERGVYPCRATAEKALKEGTLYPILYRLEDDGLIRAAWSPAGGRAAPKKIYTATEAGAREQRRRRALWSQFAGVVSAMLQGGLDDEA